MKQKAKQIGIALLYLIPLGLYCYTLLTYNVNIPKASDDVRCFIYQFINDYLQAGSFWDKIYYLFEVSTWPHPKIQARVLCIINYHLFGEINFKFMNICGSFFHLSFIYLLYRISKLSPLQYLPVFLLLCIPLRQFLLWSVSNTGSFNLILMILMFIAFQKKNYIQSGVFGFLNSFCNGIGFVVFPISYLLLMIEKRKIWVINHKRIFAWALIGIGALLAFYFFVVIQKPPKLNTIENTYEFQLSHIGSIVIYFFTFLGSSIGNYFGSYYLSFLIGCSSLFALFYSISWRKESHALQGLVIYCLLIGIMVAVMRSNYDMLFQGVWPRHEKYSALFIALVILVQIKNIVNRSESRILFGVILLSLILFGVRFNNNYLFHKKTEKLKYNKFRKEISKEKQTKIFASLKTANELGVYNIPDNVFCNNGLEFKERISGHNRQKHNAKAFSKAIVTYETKSHIEFKLNANFIGKNKKRTIQYVDFILKPIIAKSSNILIATKSPEAKNFNSYCISFKHLKLNEGKYELYVAYRNSELLSNEQTTGIMIKIKN